MPGRYSRLRSSTRQRLQASLHGRRGTGFSETLCANIGLKQEQKGGTEWPLFTAGDTLAALPLGSAEHPRYTAEDVIRYLYGA